jgi:hypothetical protein
MSPSQPFTPEQFSTRPSVAQVEADLKKWLKEIAVENRVDFIVRLWPINYPLALILVQSSQLPVKEIEGLLRRWLTEGHHNAAQQIIKYFVAMLGERKFWRVVSETELSPVMRDFINYHSQGHLDEQQRG